MPSNSNIHDVSRTAKSEQGVIQRLLSFFSANDAEVEKICDNLSTLVRSHAPANENTKHTAAVEKTSREDIKHQAKEITKDVGDITSSTAKTSSVTRVNQQKNSDTNRGI